MPTVWATQTQQIAVAVPLANACAACPNDCGRRKQLPQSTLTPLVSFHLYRAEYGEICIADIKVDKHQS